MAVYVDEAIWQWQGRKWCHLLADEIDELHRFAPHWACIARRIRGRPRPPRRITISPPMSAAAPSRSARPHATAPASLRSLARSG